MKPFVTMLITLVLVIIGAFIGGLAALHVYLSMIMPWMTDHNFL